MPGSSPSDVEQAVLYHLSRGAYTLAAVAQALGTSPRSLQRHLADRGVCFTDILTGWRRSHAYKLLRTTNLPVGEVGQAIGYADAANFGRAFRKWTGQTPRNWRASAQ